MRCRLAALMLVLGIFGLADLGSIYVPGQLVNGVYVRPHFVSVHETEFGPWQDDKGAGEPKPHLEPRSLELEPRDGGGLGEES